MYTPHGCGGMIVEKRRVYGELAGPRVGLEDRQVAGLVVADPEPRVDRAPRNRTEMIRSVGRVFVIAVFGSTIAVTPESAVPLPLSFVAVTSTRSREADVRGTDDDTSAPSRRRCSRSCCRRCRTAATGRRTTSGFRSTCPRSAVRVWPSSAVPVIVGLAGVVRSARRRDDGRRCGGGVPRAVGVHGRDDDAKRVAGVGGDDGVRLRRSDRAGDVDARGAGGVAAAPAVLERGRAVRPGPVLGGQRLPDGRRSRDRRRRGVRRRCLRRRGGRAGERHDGERRQQCQRECSDAGRPTPLCCRLVCSLVSMRSPLGCKSDFCHLKARKCCPIGTTHKRVAANFTNCKQTDRAGLALVSRLVLAPGFSSSIAAGCPARGSASPTVSFSSRTPRPSDRAICGSRFDPKSSTRMIATMISSHWPGIAPKHRSRGAKSLSTDPRRLAA